MNQLCFLVAFPLCGLETPDSRFHTMHNADARRSTVDRSLRFAIGFAFSIPAAHCLSLLNKLSFRYTSWFYNVAALGVAAVGGLLPQSHVVMLSSSRVSRHTSLVARPLLP